MALAGPSSDGIAMLCTSGFVDDVMFSITEREWTRIKDDIMFRRDRKVAPPETKLLPTIAGFLAFDCIPGTDLERTVSNRL